MERIITSLGTMGVEVADGVAEASTRVGVVVGVACEVQPMRVKVRAMIIERRGTKSPRLNSWKPVRAFHVLRRDFSPAE